MDTLAKRKREEGNLKNQKRVRIGQTSVLGPDQVLYDHQTVLGGESDEDLEPGKDNKDSEKISQGQKRCRENARLRK